jgi:hypothetical protein
VLKGVQQHQCTPAREPFCQQRFQGCAGLGDADRFGYLRRDQRSIPDPAQADEVDAAAE